MTPEQCRAASAWLGWSQGVLATAAHVGIATVKDFERGSRVPIQNNRAAIRAALEKAGSDFLYGAESDGASGITFSPLAKTASVESDKQLGGGDGTANP